MNHKTLILKIPINFRNASNFEFKTYPAKLKEKKPTFESKLRGPEESWEPNGRGRERKRHRGRKIRKCLLKLETAVGFGVFCRNRKIPLGLNTARFSQREPETEWNKPPRSTWWFGTRRSPGSAGSPVIVPRVGLLRLVWDIENHRWICHRIGPWA